MQFFSTKKYKGIGKGKGRERNGSYTEKERKGYHRKTLHCVKGEEKGEEKTVHVISAV